MSFDLTGLMPEIKEWVHKTTNGLIRSEELSQKSENRITDCPNLITQVSELNINFIAIEKLGPKFLVNVNEEYSKVDFLHDRTIGYV